MAQLMKQPPQAVEDSGVTRSNPAGRVEHDSRGKAIWRWTREALDSTSILLKRLENAALALEPTQKVPVVKGSAPATEAPAKRARTGSAGLSLEPAGGRDAAGGFDPYNSRR